MALLTQIFVFSLGVILGECHWHFINHVPSHHHPRTNMPDDTLLVLLPDFGHLNGGFDDDEMSQDPFLSDDLNSDSSLLDRPHNSAIDSIPEAKEDLKGNVLNRNPGIEVINPHETNEINTETFKPKGSHENKLHVKRGLISETPKPEEKPPTTQAPLADDDKDPNAIKYPESHDDLKTNVDNIGGANATTTKPDGSDNRNTDDTNLTKNSDYLLIPVATSNPSLSFANRFKTDETPGNPSTVLPQEYPIVNGNSYQVPSTQSQIQGPSTNPDITPQSAYDSNQGVVYGNQPVNQFDNNPSNLVPNNNYPSNNNIGSNQPLYTIVDPISAQGINNGLPSNQYYVTNNPPQNNNFPPAFNLVTLNNQPNNMVPLYNQGNNMVPINNQQYNMVPLYNQPNNMVPINDQQSNMVPSYNQPNNLVALNNQPSNMGYNQPNKFVTLNNQPYQIIPVNNQPNNFAGQNMPNNYVGMNNQPNTLQNMPSSSNIQPSNAGGYIGYGNQPTNFVSLNNQPTTFVPLNNQPSYLVHIDDLPNNVVHLNNQPNNLVYSNQPTYGNQPNYLVSLNNQPNNLVYSNQPNNMVAMNGGGPAMASNTNGNSYLLSSSKDEVESDDENQKEEPTEKPLIFTT